MTSRVAADESLTRSEEMTRGGTALTLACAWLAAVNARAPLLALGPLLPLVIPDLHLSFTVAGVLSGLPLFLMGATGLPGGWLTDRFGARQVMIWGLGAITLAGVIRALALDGTLLLGGTVVLGLAIGTLQPALPRVARDTLPKRPNLATAIYFNGLVIGGAAGVALTPFLVSMVGGWRGVLLAWAVLGALATAGWLGLRPTRQGPLRRDRLRLSDITQTLRLPGMAALTVAMGTQSSIFYTFSTWTPTYLVARGWDLSSAALPVAALPLTSIVASAMATPAELRFGRRAVIAVSGSVVAVGLALFLIWPDQSVVLCAIAAGLGTTWAFSVCIAAPAALAPAQRVGTTAGVLLALGYAESAIGPVAIGGLRDAFGSYDLGWLLVLGLAVILIGTAFGIPARTPDRVAPDEV
ncbi:MAG: MFS transporter [Chloroflexota bacterium]|nr:MFS transporter [Chloroflexota bacterium]